MMRQALPNLSACLLRRKGAAASYGRLAAAFGWVALSAYSALAQAPSPPAADVVAAPAEVPALAAPAAAEAPAAPKATAVPANSAADSLPVKSLFFSAGDMQKIYAAVNAYERYLTGQSNDGDHFLEQLAGDEKTAQHTGAGYAYPQFFLESIVYHSPADWMVRVNGYPLTPQTHSDTVVKAFAGKLRVIKVERDNVTLAWKPLNMTKINEAWEKRPNQAITVDPHNDTVVFALHTNQTFSTYAMRIVEGNPPPISADTDTAPIAAAQAPAHPSAPPEMGKPEISKTPVPNAKQEQP